MDDSGEVSFAEVIRALLEKGRIFDAVMFGGPLDGLYFSAKETTLAIPDIENHMTYYYERRSKTHAYAGRHFRHYQYAGCISEDGESDIK